MVKMAPSSKRRQSGRPQNGTGAKKGQPKKGSRATLKRTFKGRITSKGTPGGVKRGTDARLKIISKNRSKVVDARDKLASLARNSDAREKLEKIRNLKQGKLEVKTTKGGGITITQTTKGKVVLTTKKKEANQLAKKSPSGQTKNAPLSPGKNVTRNVGRGGVVSLRTRPKAESTFKTPPESPRGRQIGAVAGRGGQISPSRPGSASGSSGRPLLSRARQQQASPRKSLTRTIKGELSDSAKLDLELLRTRVDPRTFHQDVERERERRQREPLRSDRGRSPLGLPALSRPFRSLGSTSTRSPDLYDDRRLSRNRSRSPMDTAEYYTNEDSYTRRSSAHASFSHYDDPRNQLEREETYRRLVREQQRQLTPTVVADSGITGRTMGDRIESGATGVSPLQGAKVVVSNLQNTVSQEDILELFGDIGALKRAKVSTPGQAEVTFVNRQDALKAVEIYHNRQLDGKAMRCQLVGDGGLAATDALSFKLSGSDHHRAPPPSLSIVHQALFSNKRKSREMAASKPSFTVTMPKKDDRNNRLNYN